LKFHASLRDVHGDHVFYVKDGPKLRNLYELERELRRMNDAQFSHHVNDAKNDFYNWIFHIIRDEELAAQLAQVKERVAMADVVERRITLLEKGMVEDAVKTVQKPKVEAKVVTPTKAKQGAVKKQVPRIKPSPFKPAIELPKLRMTFTEIPQPVDLPAVAPLPLTFEEVEERIRNKLGHEPPQTRISAPVIPAITKLPVHHRIKHHVKTYAMHYGIAAGILLGIAIAKYFI